MAEEKEDITEDPFAEYLHARDLNKKELVGAWQVAIGLQEVDGLTPSRYLIDTAKRSIEGDITLDEAERLITSYYKHNPHQAINRVDEADTVAARIVKLLANRGFVLSPSQYLEIHRQLFEGIYVDAGKLRRYNVTKKEWILGGDTVIYGGATELEATLEYDFKMERAFSYEGLSLSEVIEHIAFFISRLWQIHAFSEGNTRTTAIFLIKYARTLGFSVDNQPFMENAWYFRNALVRANYSNVAKKISETTEYLVVFLRNALLGEAHELKNRYMHISKLFVPENLEIESENLDIGDENLDIESENLDIDVWLEDNRVDFPPVTLRHIRKLYAEFGSGSVFSRADAAPLLGIATSSASALLARLRAAHLIESVPGKGKGKYRFTAIR